MSQAPTSDLQQYFKILSTIYLKKKADEDKHKRYIAEQGSGMSGGVEKISFNEIIPHLLKQYAERQARGGAVCHHCQGSGLRLRLPL